MKNERLAGKVDSAGLSLIDRYLFRNLMVGLFIVCDALTIKSVFATFMVSDVISLLMIVIMLAVILDTLPVLMASYITKYKRSHEKKYIVYVAMALLTFICEFVFLFYLRWNTRFETFSNINDTGIINAVGDNTAFGVGQTNEVAINAICLILCVLPLFTSVTAFLMSTLQSPAAAKKQQLLKAKRKINKKLSSLYAARTQLDADWEGQLMEADQIMFYSATAVADAVFAAELERFKLLLAGRLKKSNDVSILTEDPLSAEEITELDTLNNKQED